LPLIHLDRLYWKPNWVETTDKSEWKRTIENALRHDAWILDGNYSGTLEMRLEKCDTVIFLDLPRLLCVYRILKESRFTAREAARIWRTVATSASTGNFSS
jgi:adenylate kinase family enzyme